MSCKLFPYRSLTVLVPKHNRQEEIAMVRRTLSIRLNTPSLTPLTSSRTNAYHTPRKPGVELSEHSKTFCHIGVIAKGPTQPGRFLPQVRMKHPWSSELRSRHRLVLLRE